MSAKTLSTKNALHKLIGSAKIKPLQASAIDMLGKKHDLLAILPTGYGKSMIYQVTALTKEGVGLVICPLIALMEDQVNNLKKKGVPAECIHSNKTDDELRSIKKRLQNGSIKLIYTSPEKLNSDGFIEFLSQINITLAVFDEAHCASRWGEGFRPAYKYVGQQINLIEDMTGGKIQRVAVTATANEHVQKDIIKLCQLCNPFIVKAESNRSNLRLNIIREQDKDAALMDILAIHKGVKRIIYVSTIKTGQNVSELLTSEGIGNEFYHGKISNLKKNSLTDDFYASKIDTMICTKAFGMGIDIPDVRIVIHYDCPGSIDDYQQEIGRAGRDGKAAHGYLLYHKKEIALHHRMVDSEHCSENDVSAIIELISTLDPEIISNLSIKEIALLCSVNISEKNALQILQMLSADGDIKLLRVDSDLSVAIDPHAQLRIADSHFAARQLAHENVTTMNELCHATICRQRFIEQIFGNGNAIQGDCGSCDNCIRREYGLTEFLGKYDRLLCLKRSLTGKVKIKSKRDQLISNLCTKISKSSTVNEEEKQKILIKLLKSDFDSSLDKALKNYIVNAFSESKETSDNRDAANNFENEIKKLRTTLSRKFGQPAFMLFNDKVAKAIASRMPRDINTLTLVGLSQGRSDLFGQSIIKLVEEHQSAGR